MQQRRLAGLVFSVSVSKICGVKIAETTMSWTDLRVSRSQTDR